jgi:hypothetical protein
MRRASLKAGKIPLRQKRPLDGGQIVGEDACSHAVHLSPCGGWAGPSGSALRFMRSLLRSQTHRTIPVIVKHARTFASCPAALKYRYAAGLAAHPSAVLRSMELKLARLTFWRIYS